MSKKRKLQRHIERAARRSQQSRGGCYDRTNVRLSVPFDMRCKACSEQIPVGKKRYATKATLAGESYLGVEIYVFEFACPGCGEPVGFRTDPQSGAYVEDRNCAKARGEGESVRVVESGGQEEGARKAELENIRRLVARSSAADLDALRERLRRRFFG